tara:strand:+ start:155 stop:856 length:702 start_codon:yes stop_codon:yes gene_type:complete
MLRLVAAYFILFAFALSSSAQVRVKGYYRKDGTYVAPHVRSAPDGTKSNNYGPSSSSPYYTGRGSVTPPSTRDSDGDGLANLYDWDDDNDGLGDNFDDTSSKSNTGLRIYPTPSIPSIMFSATPSPAPQNPVAPAPNLQAASQNFVKCRNGYYGCDESLLTPDQQRVSYEANLSRNFVKCRNGYYGCDESLLTPDQRKVSYDAKLSRNSVACRNGYYGCDENLLSGTKSGPHN